MRKRQLNHLLVQMIGHILAQYIRTAALRYAIDDGSKSKIISLNSGIPTTKQFSIENVDCHHDKRNWFPLTFKFVIWVNAFPQSPHTYGRTCEWIRSWFRRLAACVKARRRKSMTIMRGMWNFRRFSLEWSSIRLTFLASRTMVLPFSCVISNMR